MYKIKTMNKISKKGLAVLDQDLYEIGDAVENEDGILVRSAALHEYAFPESIQAVARAGAGTNNIPLDKCAQAGIVVFNTPGANANAVKELAICALLMASRKIPAGIGWCKAQAAEGAEVSKVVEKGKAQFVGPEIMGKTLCVIGLGAIGALVANAALDLGMTVYGYDPFLSPKAALALDPRVKVFDSLDVLFKAGDYFTIHVPFNDQTKDTINADTIAMMKDGARIINLARGGLVNDDAVIAAIESPSRAARWPAMSPTSPTTSWWPARVWCASLTWAPPPPRARRTAPSWPLRRWTATCASATSRIPLTCPT